MLFPLSKMFPSKMILEACHCNSRVMPDSTLPEFLEGVVKESPSSETRALASESHHTSLRGGPCPQEGGQLEGEVTALRPQTQKPRPT